MPLYDLIMQNQEKLRSLENLFREYKFNLDHFFGSLDQKKTEQIFELFLNCTGKLIFTGVGKSGIVAKKLASSMVSTGIPALYLSSINALHGDIGMISPNDLMIFISRSGENRELLDLATLVKNRGMVLTSWVSSPSSHLADLSDVAICLPFVKELCPFDLAPTTSSTVQLIFGDILLVALMQARGVTFDDYALNHPAGAIGKKTTTRVYDLMLVEERMPLCSPDQLLREAIVEMTEKRCGCLLVIDMKRHLKGIFTDGDLRRFIQREGASIFERSMSDLMTSNFISIDRNILAWQALRLMQKDPGKKVMMLPVLEGKKLAGLLHMHDIVSSGIS